MRRHQRTRRQPRRPRTRPALALLARLLTVAVSLTACSVPGGGDDSVEVLALWTGVEEEAFREVLDAFTRETGTEYDYQGTRALNETLRSRVQQGNPPDVAMPGPSELATYLRSGDLHPLNNVLDPADLDAYVREAMLPDEGLIYAVPIKANLKSLIWYNPGRFAGPPPRTWDELAAATQAMAAGGQAAWCLGMGDPPSSGWPGTDWIEDILLHQAGPEVYQRWTAGELAWSSQEIRDAWATWGEIVRLPGAVRGGAPAALLTDFRDTGRGLFSDPPGCSLTHQPSFALDVYRGFELEDGNRPQPGTDFDFFPFPEFSGGSGGAVLGAVDLAAMFDDTPQARELMRFLATREAQEIWPRSPDTSAFSLNQEVDPATVYGADAHDVRRRIAAVLTDPDVTMCQDASDLMPTAMRNAFHRAVQESLNNPDLDQLEALLTGLDQVQETVDREEWLDVPCGG